MNTLRVFDRQAASHFSRAQPLRNLSTRNLSILQPSQRALFHQPCTACRARPTIPRHIPKAPLRNPANKLRYNSSKSSPDPNPTAQLGSPEPTSLSARLKKLSREYGWSALGVYLALSALDFPFCFLAVRLLGTDRIGRWEHTVINFFWSIVRVPFPDLAKDTGRRAADGVDGELATVRGGGADARSDVTIAEEANSGTDATIWTQLALAYAIHKSFIFIRVPLTAAILPKVVKTLRGWGWDIGKRITKTKAVKHS